MLTRLTKLEDSGSRNLIVSEGDKLQFRIASVVTDLDSPTYALPREIKAFGVRRYKGEIEVSAVENPETFRSNSRKSCRSTLNTPDEGLLDFYLVIIGNGEVNHIMVAEDDGEKEVVIAIAFTLHF